MKKGDNILPFIGRVGAQDFLKSIKGRRIKKVGNQWYKQTIYASSPDPRA